MIPIKKTFSKYSQQFQKKELNRISSKNYRNRKKKYIKSLEEKIISLHSKIKVIKQKFEFASQNNKLSNFSRLISINDLAEGKQNLLYKMKELLKLNDSEKIAYTVAQYKLRYGSQSVERKRCIEYLTSKLLEIILPYAYRYGLFTACQGNGYFNPTNSIFCTDYGNTNFDETKLSCWDSVAKEVRVPLSLLCKIENSKDFIINTRNIMAQNAQNIIQCKDQMLNIMKNFEIELNKSFIDSLDSVALAQFLVWIEDVIIN